MVNGHSDTVLTVLSDGNGQGTTLPVERSADGYLTYEAYCVAVGVDVKAARRATVTKALFALLASDE